MGYEVEISAVRRAGGQAVSAGEQASKVDLATLAHEVATAMPGSSDVARAAGRLSDAWAESMPGWASAEREFGQAMQAAAERYRSDDAAAAEAFAVDGVE